MTAHTPGKIAFSKGNIFIAEVDGGVEIADVRNIEMPEKVNELSADSINDIFIKENLAYAAANDKLSILDVSDSKRIKKITSKKVGYKIRNILQNKDRIYIAGSRNISSFDITQPGKLMWAIEYELIEGIENIFVGDDGNIYVAAGSDGLRVLIIDGKHKKTIQD